VQEGIADDDGDVGAPRSIRIVEQYEVQILGFGTILM
jgi:hypothetical protein